MKLQIFVLATFCFTSTMMYGQLDSNRVFEKCKGTWNSPISEVKKIRFPNLNSFGSSIACFPGGVRFYTDIEADFYSVAAGTVAAVVCLDDVQGIIIRYGDYYVAYSELSMCYVKKNDEVVAGSKIGRLIPYPDKDFQLEVCLSLGLNQVEDMDKWYSDKLRKYFTDN